LFDAYLKLWRLTPDGDAIVTRTSKLLPVRYGSVPAMLKIALDAEEARGNDLMAWWSGEGAARVLARRADAIVLERATADASLAALTRMGRDSEALRVMCATIALLHRARPKPPPALFPLDRWFADLLPAAQTHGGVLSLCAETARNLLVAPREVTVLHGDIHHGNVLHFDGRGWLAIDPKALIGERGFDYANLFCNPDHATATDQARFVQRLDVVADAAAIERRRLLRWILAWAGLSASWLINDGDSAETPLRVAELAAAALVP
jgi:streptomycin 6-kinase